jgi:hypothetical protein
MTAQLTPEETLPVVDGSVKDHPNLASALVAAQKEMPAVEPSKPNPAFKGSMYVTLGQLIAAVRPVLNRNGIAVVQMPAQDEQGRPALITRLLHESGDAAESVMPLVMDKPTAQGLGSALTYAKRYALASALAIADQEDDDGNAATTSSVPPASDKQIATLSKAMGWLLPNAAAAAGTWDEVKAQCGGEITGPVANALIVAIKARKDSEDQEIAAVQDAAAEQPDAPSPDPDPAGDLEDDLPAADEEGLS